MAHHGFRPENEALATTVLPGEDLRRDLTVFVQDLATDTEFAATDREGGAMSSLEAAQRLGVSVRTLQRWRDRGLPLVPIRFADGHRRHGCFVEALDKFVANEPDLVSRAARFNLAADRPPDAPPSEEGSRPSTARARRLVLRAHDRRLPETLAAARLGRAVSTVRRLLLEARTARLRLIEPWEVELPTASLPFADEVFAVAGALDDVARSLVGCDPDALVERFREVERGEDTDHAVSRIAALHFLHARAWRELACDREPLGSKALDRVERDVVWSELLLERATIGVVGEALRRFEQSIGRRMGTLEPAAFGGAVRFVLGTSAAVIRAFDPARKDAWEALHRSVGFAVARAVAQQEQWDRPGPQAFAPTIRPAALHELLAVQRWWRTGAGETLDDDAKALLALRHGVGAERRPLTLIEMGQRLGRPPSHLRIPLEHAERTLRRAAIAHHEDRS